MKLNFDDNFESSARYLDEYFIFFCCSPEQVRQKENIDFSRKNNRPPGESGRKVWTKLKSLEFKEMLLSKSDL